MLELISIQAAKSSAAIIKALNLGKASALPGRVALALDPWILENFAKRLRESENAFFTTGTNGKTTSTGILKQIIIKELERKQENNFVICNDMGANLYYGICSELVQATNYLGQLKSTNFSLELDEAAFVKVAKVLKPKIITVTNIYRDQLDRFGEIDSTQRLIIQGIKNSLVNNPCDIQLVLNADDNKVLEIKSELAQEARIKPFLFNVRYSKDSLGHSEIEIKNFEQEQMQDIAVDLLCEIKEEYSDFSILNFKTKDAKQFELRLNLPGLYNVYNAAAAVAAALSAGIELDAIKAGVEAYKTVFGRSEKRNLNGVDFQVFLIKNPTGCTEVIKHLSKNPHAKFLIAINDNYADGRDVSWLWDAEFDLLKQVHSGDTKREFLCSGHRAYDMALRLKYAGIAPESIKVEPDFEKALLHFTSHRGSGEELYLLPTYTVLLELNQKF